MDILYKAILVLPPESSVLSSQVQTGQWGNNRLGHHRCLLIPWYDEYGQPWITNKRCFLSIWHAIWISMGYVLLVLQIWNICEISSSLLLLCGGCEQVFSTITHYLFSVPHPESSTWDTFSISIPPTVCITTGGRSSSLEREGSGGACFSICFCHLCKR